MTPGATRQESEAAAWLVRLSRTVVPQDDLTRFRTWRRDPANDDAFQHQQDLWRRAGRLPLDAGLENALLGAQGRRAAQTSAFRRGALALAATVAVGGGVTAWIQLHPDAYATSVGERSQIALADGSSITLDANSRVTVALGRSARAVVLQSGQALFNVAHDARRPFTVTAGDLRVTAIGTRFDVRREVGADARVTLLQGRVQVLAGPGRRATRLALDPGQETSAGRPTVRAAPMEDEVAWTSGRLVFRAQPLREVVAEANRYSRRRLRLESGPKLDAIRVTGSFTAGDTSAVAQALADLCGLKVSGDPDGTVVLSPA